MWPGGTQPMLLPESSCVYIPSFRSVAPRVFLAKIPFFFSFSFFYAFFHYHSSHFPDLLAHVLSWVKSYHHAKFQRNLSTGWARMMVQIYTQTDRHTDRQTYRHLLLYIFIYIGDRKWYAFAIVHFKHSFLFS